MAILTFTGLTVHSTYTSVASQYTSVASQYTSLIPMPRRHQTPDILRRQFVHVDQMPPQMLHLVRDLPTEGAARQTRVHLLMILQRARVGVAAAAHGAAVHTSCRRDGRGRSDEGGREGGRR